MRAGACGRRATRVSDGRLATTGDNSLAAAEARRDAEDGDGDGGRRRGRCSDLAMAGAASVGPGGGWRAGSAAAVRISESWTSPIFFLV